MKKFCAFVLTFALVTSLFAGGKKETASSSETWPNGPVTVICPWAVGGVADLVNRKTATYGQEVLGQPILATNELGAGGSIALTNYLKNGANSLTLILGGEGAFAVSPNVPGGEAIQFKYSDYIPVINLYSAIFVMTADAKLNITNLEQLQAYGQSQKIKVAVNGMTGSESFLARALFKELGVDYELISYNGANLALDAAAKGETQFAISHQSQARAAVEAGTLNPVVVFDKTGVNNEVYKNVKGVGDYGYGAYYRNRAILMVRAGTSDAVVKKLYDAYSTMLKKPEIVDFFKTLMIEIDPIGKPEIDQHMVDVAAIVKSNI